MNCINQCGKTASDDERDDNHALRLGWTHLPVANGWRCGECCREMTLASNATGVGTSTTDTLHPSSIGALRKPTADTILPPVVKA